MLFHICPILYPAIYEAGQRDALQDIFVGRRPARIQPSTGALHQRSLETLTRNLYNHRNLDNNVGRRVVDHFRKMGLEAARGVITGEEAWSGSMRKLLKNFNAQNIGSFTDKSGKNWGLKAYAEMVARTVPMRVMNDGKRNEFLSYGRDLVVVSKHEGTCEKCEPWESTVLSISGTDDRFRSLAEAESAGLYHPNCRHSEALYVPEIWGEPDKTGRVMQEIESPPHDADIERLEATLRDCEMKIKDLTTHEEGYIISPTGEIIHHEIGKARGVSPPLHLIENNIFTHNHPSGVCAFSDKDLYATMALDAQGLRVVTSDGKYVDLQRPKAGWDMNMLSLMEHDRVIGKGAESDAKNVAIAKHGASANRRQIALEEAVILNKWLREHSEEYGYTFKEGSYVA